MVMSVFITQGEERSCDTPADLLIGWGKRVLMTHLLAGWGCIGVGWEGGGGQRWPEGGRRGGREGVGQVAQVGGGGITMRWVGR